MRRIGLVILGLFSLGLIGISALAEGGEPSLEGNYTLHPVYAAARLSPYGEVHNNCISRVTVRVAARDQASGEITRLEVIDRDTGTFDSVFKNTNLDGSPAPITDTYAEYHTYWGRAWIKLYKNSYFWEAPRWNKLKIYNGELCEFTRDQ